MKHAPQALYIHVPFCAAKCAYCAFYSLPAPAAAQRRQYLNRIAAEFADTAPRTGPLKTVFIGGGTPSFLSDNELRELLQAVRSSFTFAPDAEFTIECNPDSLNPDKIAVLVATGVNRVSLGIQSFSPRFRACIGRQGGLAGLERHIALLRDHGIANLGADLIYAIPGQTLADWEADLRQTLALGVQHLSTYALTVEENTRLTGDAVRPVDEQLAVDMWDRAAQVAESAGLRRYEVSNLAVPGAECRHNLDIWYGAAYLGCGPAASSYDGMTRWTHRSSLDEWLRHVSPETDVLTPQARAAEVLTFGLRTVAGWPRKLFRERTGFDLVELRGEAIASLVRDGLLELTPDVLRPTRQGLLFADTVAEQLL
ncbi:MAG: hypothetical protein A3K19_17645 [Lentisphaerae bacterium RIFOXYB12_FULL_65_16]|nr:MAG: hypothetical protein A3K18_28800 [Lentisphaerae bacterium RIFOXYA12_64_32]OGV90108.1 MAG: hypothetical protein A3K19_17645 [Lentisphaerae bacterium RIFOXYB12_FULL_65_16]